MTKIRDGLYLGGPGEGCDVDRRINVSGRRYPGSTDHLPLTNSDCDQELFDTAVETVLSAIRDGETVLVHCSQGRSRSAAVMACVLAELEDTDLRTVLAELDRLHGIALSDAMRGCALNHRQE